MASGYLPPVPNTPIPTAPSFSNKFVNFKINVIPPAPSLPLPNIPSQKPLSSLRGKTLQSFRKSRYRLQNDYEYYVPLSDISEEVEELSLSIDSNNNEPDFFYHVGEKANCSINNTNRTSINEKIGFETSQDDMEIYSCLIGKIKEKSIDTCYPEEIGSQNIYVPYFSESEKSPKSLSQSRVLDTFEAELIKLQAELALSSHSPLISSSFGEKTSDKIIISIHPSISPDESITFSNSEQAKKVQ